MGQILKAVCKFQEERRVQGQEKEKMKTKAKLDTMSRPVILTTQQAEALGSPSGE